VESKEQAFSNEFSYDGATCLSLINGIARGDDFSERVGRTVTVKSIQLKCELMVTVSTGVDQVVRIMIVYDKQANAAAPTIAQILHSSADYSRPLQFRNLENRQRFVILGDVTKTLNASAESGSKSFWKFYKKCSLPETFNSGDAGTVADIVTGSIYVITLGSMPTGNTAATLRGFSRVRYIDG